MCSSQFLNHKAGTEASISSLSTYFNLLSGVKVNNEIPARNSGAINPSALKSANDDRCF